MDRQKQIAARLKRAREDMGISQEALGKLYGCTGAAISQMERGIRPIGIEALYKLAPLVNKESVDWFLQDQTVETQRPPKAALYDLEVSINAYIPVYSEVSAGPGIEPIDFVAFTRAKPAPESYKAFRVKGLSMEPEIKDGDTVIVDTDLTPRHGDLVVCIIEGVASIKLYKEDEKGDKWLENHFGKYRPEEVQLAWVVVEHSRRRR